MSSKTKPLPPKLLSQIGTRVDKRTAARISAVAAKLGWSKSQVVRWLVEHGLPHAEALQIS